MGTVRADNYYAANGTSAPTFPAGVIVDDEAGQSTLNYYRTGSTASTFVFDGSGGTSASITMNYQRIGNWVFIEIPSVTATTGTSSTKLSSNTAIDSWARPTVSTGGMPCLVQVNGSANVTQPGSIVITTAGVIEIYRDANGTAWTNAQASSGLTGRQTLVMRFT